MTATPAAYDVAGHADRLLAVIAQHRRRNSRKWAYYRSHRRMKDLRIAIPPGLAEHIAAVVGWPGTIVDVLDERLDWLGYAGRDGSSDPYGLDDLAAENMLGAISPHVDTLVTGVSYAVAGRGAHGEPDVLVTLESADRATLEVDRRTYRPKRGLVVTDYTVTEAGRDGEKVAAATAVTLYEANTTHYLTRPDASARWREVHRVTHELGRPTMTRWTNRPSVRHPDGRSEITRPIIYYAQHAMRSLAGAEVAREMFTSPQRWITGVSEEEYEDLSTWQAYLGRWVGLTAREDGGPDPQVGQFPGESPAPFYASLERLANLTAAEAAIPVAYLGEHAANPHSAEAMRVAEARTDRRTARRQRGLDLGYMDLGALMLTLRDGDVPEDYRARVVSSWADSRIPTPAADADAVTKLVSVGLLPPDSTIARRRAGLTAAEADALADTDRAARGRDRIAALRDAARAARERPEVAEVADARDDPEAPEG